MLGVDHNYRSLIRPTYKITTHICNCHFTFVGGMRGEVAVTNIFLVAKLWFLLITSPTKITLLHTNTCIKDFHEHLVLLY